MKQPLISFILLYLCAIRTNKATFSSSVTSAPFYHIMPSESGSWFIGFLRLFNFGLPLKCLCGGHAPSLPKVEPGNGRPEHVYETLSKVAFTSLVETSFTLKGKRRTFIACYIWFSLFKKQNKKTNQQKKNMMVKKEHSKKKRRRNSVMQRWVKKKTIKLNTTRKKKLLWAANGSHLVIIWCDQLWPLKSFIVL